MADPVEQRRTATYLVLDARQYLQYDPVGQLLHEGFVIEVQEPVQAGVGNVDNLILMQPVNNGNDP